LDRIKRHWLSVVGALSLVVPVANVVLHIVELAGDVDFVIARIKDPGWLRIVGHYLLVPPWWATPFFIAFGLGLIYLDNRRSNRRIKKEQERSSNNIVPSPLIPIADAIDIIIDHFRPEWGPEVAPGTYVTMAAHRLREAASRDLITIEGRREINRHHPIGDRFSNIWTEIDKKYWLDTSLSCEAPSSFGSRL